MSTRMPTLRIENFFGVNRRDGGDKILNNEFLTIQNFYQATKGLFYKRAGTSYDNQVFPGATKVTGLHRHPGSYRSPLTIYHCAPDGTTRPTPSTDLTFAEISGGSLFNGGAVTPVRICYTMVGLGAEGHYNTKYRAGYVATANLDSWNQTGHQTFTPSANTKGIRITVPAFPAGIRSINLFASIGNMEMTYIGSVSVSGGTLDFVSFIGPSAALADTPPTVDLSVGTGGSLSPGTYFICAAWLADSGCKENLDGSVPYVPSLKLSAPASITLIPGQTAIQVGITPASSTNGAQSAYIFIGTRTPEDHPLTFAGITSVAGLSIAALPDQSNAQTFNVRQDLSNVADVDNPCFANGIGYAILETYRPSFLLKKDANGISEIFQSRTLNAFYSGMANTYYDPISGGSHNLLPLGISSSATLFPGVTLYEPAFAQFQNLAVFVNGVDLQWQTDGFTLAITVPKVGTYLPPISRFLSVFQGTLISASLPGSNLVYGSNALEPRNWASGGSGFAGRFVQIGEAYSDSPTAIAVYSRTTDAINSPGAYFLGFKKNGVWMLNTFPDPTGGNGASMIQLSGRIGCLAQSSIVSTTFGVVFLGSDGDIYVIRGGSEPERVGTKVQPLLKHLIQNDSLMKMCTAVFHDNHYKLSYPSSATSTGNDAQLWADMRIDMENPKVLWSGPHIGINVGRQIVRNGENDDGARMGLLSNGAASVILDDTTTYQDLGSPIVSSIGTKVYRNNLENNIKRYIGALIDAFYDSSFTHNLLVEFFADQYYAQRNMVLSSGGATWDGSQFDQSLWSDALFEPIAATLGQNLNGRTLSLKITHSDDAPIIFAKIMVPYQPERRTFL